PSFEDRVEVSMGVWRIADADHRAAFGQRGDRPDHLLDQIGRRDERLPGVARLPAMLHPIGFHDDVYLPAAGTRLRDLRIEQSGGQLEQVVTITAEDT